MTGLKSGAGHTYPIQIRDKPGCSGRKLTPLEQRVNSPLFNQRREQRSESLTNPQVVSSPQHHCFKDN